MRKTIYIILSLLALAACGKGGGMVAVVENASGLPREKETVEIAWDELRRAGVTPDNVVVTAPNGAQEPSQVIFDEAGEPETLLSLLDGKRTEGLAPSFNANNLTASVIANCSIRFVTAEEDRERVNGFLEKLLGVNAGAAALVSEKFFYVG